MSDTLIEQKPAKPKAYERAERIAAQPRSGMSVNQFRKEHGLDPNAYRNEVNEGMKMFRARAH
jgi:hypothetical protein